MGVKDAIWALIYVVSFATVWNTYKNKLSNLEATLVLMKKVIYQKSGVLNLIDSQTCREHRATFKADLTKVENASELLNEKLDKINENVLIIMVHLNIDRTKIKEL